MCGRRGVFPGDNATARSGGCHSSGFRALVAFAEKVMLDVRNLLASALPWPKWRGPRPLDPAEVLGSLRRILLASHACSLFVRSSSSGLGKDQDFTSGPGLMWTSSVPI